MKARRHLGTLASALLALGLAGCAVPLQVPAPSGAPNLSEREAKAAALTRQGDLARALVEWRVLEALSAGRADIVRERRRLEAEIDRRAQAAFASGRKALARGKRKQARRNFLAVLRIDPNHDGAIEELRKIEVVRVRQRRPKYVDYTSARAAARPAETAKPRAAAAGATSRTVPDATPVRRASDLKAAAALADRGAHERAIGLLEAHLKRHPQDREAQARLSSSHAAIGLALFKAGKLEQSLAHLETSAAAGEGDPQVTRTLAEAKGRLAQAAYEKGLKAFRQDLTRAIAFWEETLAYDPAHAKARYYLDKAYKIQATLKSTKP